MVYHDKNNPSPEVMLGQFTAYVEDISDDGLCILVDGMSLQARQAVSCLLEPKINDYVLCWAQGDEIFVTDVLKIGSGERRLRLHHAVTELTGNNLTIHMEDELSIKTKIMRIASKHFQQWSEHMDITAKRMIQTIHHCTAHFHERHQRIDQLDAKKVGTSMLQAEDAIIQQADSQILAGKEDIRMDAKRISMG